jgi:hypothetical protein
LECGEFSPLSAGGLTPSRVVSRTFLPKAVAAGLSPRRSARRCLADQSAKPGKRRQVAALQSGAAALANSDGVTQSINVNSSAGSRFMRPAR